MLRIATRASALARWQADRVGALLGVLLNETVEYVFDRRPPVTATNGPTCTRSVAPACS